MLMLLFNVLSGDSAVLTLTGFSLLDIVNDGSRDAFASIIVNTDGTIDGDNGLNGVVQKNASTDWVIPNSAGGGSYEALYTRVSGLTTPDSGPALDVWHNLGTQRIWTVTRTLVEGVGSDTFTGTLKIRLVGNAASEVSANHTTTATQF